MFFMLKYIYKRLSLCKIYIYIYIFIIIAYISVLKITENFYGDNLYTIFDRSNKFGFLIFFIVLEL